MGEQPVEPGLFDPPPEKVKGIRDPAMAVAVAKCIAYTLEPGKRFIYKAHPKECRFCKVPMERKMAALLEFNEWAGFTHVGASADSVDWPDLQGSVEAYMRLPSDEQRRYSAAQAGYDPDWYETNTGYEYPLGYGSHAEGIGKSLGSIRGETESDIDDKKTEGPKNVGRAQGDVARRPGAGQPDGRGVGGPEAAKRTHRRGIPDPEAPTSGPEEGGPSVPPDRYRDDKGNQPF